MSYQDWVGLVGVANADSTALTASTTPTSILHSSSRTVLPSGYFDRVGKAIRITAKGRMSNIVTTPGTLTLDVRMGPAFPPTIVVWNGGAISLNVVAKTNLCWSLDLDLHCRAIGSGTSANLIGIGRFTSECVVGATALQPLTIFLPASAPAVGTGFDSTVANVIDLFGTWSLNNANSILTHTYTLEAGQP
jgi:hypothetical protein